jgi:DNA adenine methylase
MMLRSPIWYFGGKGRMVVKLLKLLPLHKIYVEVFGGGASLLFAKPPSPVEVYNDLDSDLVNLFRVIRDPDKFKEFYRFVSLTPYSKEEFYYCKDTIDSSKDDIERAYKYFVISRQSFSGMKDLGWGYNITASIRNMASSVSEYLSIIAMLPQIANRLLQVQIEHDDFRKIIPRYDTPETLFYVDPPYMPDTRRAGGYKHEMTAEDHEDLLKLLLGVRGKVVLSGYNNELYSSYLDSREDWRRVDYKTVCYATIRSRNSGLQGKGMALLKQSRTESVWMNYKTQYEDFSFELY